MSTTVSTMASTAANAATTVRAQRVGDRPQQVSLSLVSHTNNGKTTLARTLLGRDVGEVRDAAHVTEFAEPFTLEETAEGDLLHLWDTPGFGDSTRLARRLEQSGNPIGWMISQIWDRLRDRPMWSSQQAIRNVREEADVILYLVNATEDPCDASYLAPEMRILDWIGKPVIVLLNQMGMPRPASDEAAEIERWRRHFTGAKTFRGVLAFDAFARCWVQEAALFDTVAEALPATKRPAFERLIAVRRQRQSTIFDASMRELAQRIARAALDSEPIPLAGLKDRLREVGQAISSLIGTPGDDSGPRRAAMRSLAERLEADVRGSTDRMIALHGLAGHATTEVLLRLARHYAVSPHVDEASAAVLGGLVSGSLAGLKADIATGGLTLGGGLIAGGLLGALGAAGLARGYNLVRGETTAAVTWADGVFADLLVSALLGYLAVAHYGRGRGDWSESEHPGHWEGAVRTELAARRGQVDAILAQRAAHPAPERLVDPLQALLAQAARAVLARLYPQR